MKGVRSRWTVLVALLVSAVVAASPHDAFAQQAATTMVIRNYCNKADMEKGTEQGWAAVVQQCSTVDDACAAAANAEVTAEYAADAQLFKHAKNRKVLSFALILASAVFTGAGAASTIVSSTMPKIFSTLGGRICIVCRCQPFEFMLSFNGERIVGCGQIVRLIQCGVQLSDL